MVLLSYKKQVVKGVTTMMPITSVEDKTQRRLEVKAKSTLMMDIPNEHQLKFNSIKDAKQPIEAIEKRFGRNAATKKTQRNLLKQQYEKFTTLNSEMLDQTFDRLQKLISQLELLDLDTMSMDDLYNNQKVYELEVKRMSSSSTSTQNMAFVSSSNNNSTNRAVNTAIGVFTAGTQVNTANTDNLNDAVICTFLASQPSSPQLKIRMKLTIYGNEITGFDKTNVECYNCHKKVHFARECRAPRSQDTKHKESTRRIVPVETPASTAVNEQLKKDLKKSKLMVLEYKTGLESVEERLKFFKTNKAIYLEDIKLSKVAIQMKDIAIKELRRKLELAQKEKDNIQLTVDKLENASKRNFMPPKHDLSFTRLDKFANKHVGVNSEVDSSQAKPKEVRKNPDALIIKPKVVVNVVKCNIVNAVKASSCWVWKPKTKVTDHVSKYNSASIILKKFNYGNPQMDLQDKGVIESRCSRHITGNLSYLTDYEEIDGGYVAIGGNPKREKITGKGKFNGKVDEGFFVGYSMNSKAFRVFNSRRRIVEENLHIRFSESTPNAVGSGPNWLFDIDALTRTINYEPIAAGTQSNGFADTNSSQDDGFQPSRDDGKKVDEDPRQESECKDKEKEDNVNNTNNVNVAGIHEVNIVGANTNNELPFDLEMPALEDISTFNFSTDLEDDDEMDDMHNLDTTI
nr:hypothetical protein [Tanacetum cinerariifolium]